MTPERIAEIRLITNDKRNIRNYVAWDIARDLHQALDEAELRIDTLQAEVERVSKERDESINNYLKRADSLNLINIINERDDYIKSANRYMQERDSLKAERDVAQSQVSNGMDEISRQRLEIDTLRTQVTQLMEALEYYAKHESVIKEAYHSNEDKQITCVHTFINHVAREALAKGAGIRGEKENG